MAFTRDFKGFSGGTGTLNDPIKINKPARGTNVYIPENSVEDNWGRGPVTIPRGSKLYFEIDPAAIVGGQVSALRVAAQFFEGAGTVCKLTQDKMTGNFSPEVCFGSDSLIEIIQDGQPYHIDSTKFLYALVGSPDGDVHEAIEVTIIPYTGAEVVAQPAAAIVQPVAPAVITTTEFVPPGTIVQRVSYNGGTIGLDSSGNPVQNSYIPNPVTLLPAPQASGQPAGQVLTQEPVAIQPSAPSIMSGIPMWGWIALVGVGAFMLLGSGKGKKG